jgi:uncharacterized protein (TIGR02246 family)
MDSVHETIDRFRDAWNRHEARDLASLWTEDGELLHPWGQRRVGRAAICETLRSEHSGSMACSEMTIGRIVAQGNERTVFVEIDAVLAGVRAPNGRSYDLPHLMSALFERHGDGWLIRTMTPIANPAGREPIAV